MAHIHKFGLKNFRVFKDMTEFEFAPITVLTGPNNSGKSSIIKAFLLLKNSIPKKLKLDDEAEIKIPDIDKLYFASPNHKLASFESCVNDKSKNNEITFKFTLDLGFGEESYVELSYIKSKRETSNNGYLNSIKVFSSSEDKLLFNFTKNKNDKWAFWANYTYFRAKADNIALNLIKTKNANKLKNREDEERAEYIKKRKLELKSKKKNNIKLSEAEEDEIRIYHEENKKLQAEVEDWGYIQQFCRDDIIFDIGGDSYDSEITIDLDKCFPNQTLNKLSFSKNFTNRHFILNKISNDEINTFKYLLSEFKIDVKDDINADYIYSFINANIKELNQIIKNFLLEAGFVFENDKQLIEMLVNSEAMLYESLDNEDFPYSPSSLMVETYFENPKSMAAQLYKYVENICMVDIFDLDFEKKLKFESCLHRLILAMIAIKKKVLSVNPKMALSYGFILMLSGNKLEYAEYFIEKVVFKSLENALKMSLNCLNSINYSEAVRANTQRVYSYNTQGTEMNELLIEFENLELDNDSKEITFINFWIKEFEIGNKLFITQNKDGLGTQVFLDDKTLADIGYGVTQFLPILLKIAIVARKNLKLYEHQDSQDGYNSSILFIEEPETNLHPKLQSMLADMFVDAAKKFHIQFVLETHSEYIIRKLQYLVANKKHECNIKPEHTAIYYFNKLKKRLNKDEEQVRRIRIREDGLLDGNFGTGFFDEASILIKEIYKYSGAN